MFKFIHAADIHLDSPLKGLERREGAPVDLIREASRRALANMVRLAIDERVDFVLIAGDLYDGDWKDFKTGLYFVQETRRLRDAGIPLHLISGNHDAESRITKDLTLPENAKRYSTKAPETVRLESLKVAIHGQGFAHQSVEKNLAAEYPAAIAGWFNIGLLHTSADGRPGHATYAPCTIEGLRAKGYDYWALGHVHTREVLNPGDPWIVFSGNIQGRHIREPGPKGCYLVTVNDAGTANPDFRALDVLRWDSFKIDLSDSPSALDALDRVTEKLRFAWEAREDRPLALRLELAGECQAHRELAATPRRWKEEIRSRAADVGGDELWIERITFDTRDPRSGEEIQGPLSYLRETLASLRGDLQSRQAMLESLAELRKKLPTELTEGPDAIPWEDETWLANMLERVEPMLAARLSGSVESEESNRP